VRIAGRAVLYPNRVCADHDADPARDGSGSRSACAVHGGATRRSGLTGHTRFSSRDTFRVLVRHSVETADGRGIPIGIAEPSAFGYALRPLG
jgi:hypothetical protein